MNETTPFKDNELLLDVRLSFPGPVSAEVRKEIARTVRNFLVDNYRAKGVSVTTQVPKVTTTYETYAALL